MEKLFVYGGTAVAGIVLVVIYVAIACLPIYIVGSALTSGIKAATQQCGKTYPVEAVLSGNWFCPNN